MARALGECANIAAFESLLTQTNGRRQTASNYLRHRRGGKRLRFRDLRGPGSPSSTPRTRASRPSATSSGRTMLIPRPANRRGGLHPFRTRFETGPDRRRGTEPDPEIHPPIGGPGPRQRKTPVRPAGRARSRATRRTPLHILANDTINRSATASAVIFQGAASVEKSALTTMWVLLGQPVTTAAVPLWAAAEKVPAVLSGPKTAPVNDFARALAVISLSGPAGGVDALLERDPAPNLWRRRRPDEAISGSRTQSWKIPDWLLKNGRPRCRPRPRFSSSRTVWPRDF